MCFVAPPWLFIMSIDWEPSAQSSAWPPPVHRSWCPENPTLAQSLDFCTVPWPTGTTWHYCPWDWRRQHLGGQPQWAPKRGRLLPACQKARWAAELEGVAVQPACSSGLHVCPQRCLFSLGFGSLISNVHMEKRTHGPGWDLPLFLDPELSADGFQGTCKMPPL